MSESPGVRFVSDAGWDLDVDDVATAYAPLLDVLETDGALDPALKDMAAMLVGWLNNCRHTVGDRCASARRWGVGADVMRQVISLQWDDFEKPVRLVLEFTQQLTLLPQVTPYALQPQMVDAELLAHLSQHFNDAELADLALTVSVWNALTRFQRVMGVESDRARPPRGTDPGERQHFPLFYRTHL